MGDAVKELRTGGHHDCEAYASVIEHDGDADRGVLFCTVVGPNAGDRAREIVEAVNIARTLAERFPRAAR